MEKNINKSSSKSKKKRIANKNGHRAERKDAPTSGDSGQEHVVDLPGGYFMMFLYVWDSHGGLCI